MYPPTMAAGCPICGGDCNKPTKTDFGNRGFVVTSVQRSGPGLETGPEFRFRSRERVKWVNPATGNTELRYGTGTPVPLIEALRQGLVEVSQLTDEEKQQVREHAERDPQTREALVAALRARRPANKMVKEQDTVQK